MGLVHTGVPKDLVLKLKDALQIDVFVETGTYVGATAVWASQIFRSIYTIEASLELWVNVSQHYLYLENIQFMHGKSTDKLDEICSQLRTPALFWLDAHWSAGITYGADMQCPLLKEIEILNKLDVDNYILIDDARLFMSTPPLPHKPDQWPDIASVIESLNVRERFIVIIEDVIVAVPPAAKPIITEYCQNSNLKAWANWLARNRPPIALRALNKVKRIVRPVQ